MRFSVLLFALAAAACTENNLFNFTTGPDGGGSVSAPSSAITQVRLEPSQFELTNGDRTSAEVRAFVGPQEVRGFDFSVSVEPNQSVLTIERIRGNVIELKAESPGNTTLVVSVRPGIEARAPVSVVRASE